MISIVRNVGHPGWVSPVVLMVALGLGGCTGGTPAEAGPPDEPAAEVEAVDGSQPARVTLSDRAVQRLGIRTEPVKVLPARPSGQPRSLVVPYAAVIYDAEGDAWVFVRQAPTTYVRAPIVVRSIASGSAVLTSGPPSGTPVVTVGAPELVGAEAGISGEE
jgi:hypothetical protein